MNRRIVRAAAVCVAAFLVFSGAAPPAPAVPADVSPVPLKPGSNVELTFKEAAERAVAAARPSVAGLELTRKNVMRRIDEIHIAVERARDAIDADDRYLELKEQEELYQLALDEDLALELAAYEASGYEELTQIERRMALQTRDQGLETFNLEKSRIEHGIELAERGAEYSAYAQYAGVAKLQAAIGLAEASLEVGKEDLEKTRAAFALGNVSRLELDNAELSYERAQLSRDILSGRLKTILVSFNLTLGEHRDTTYASFDVGALVKDSRARSQTWYLNRALKNRSEIVLASESLRLAEERLTFFDDEPINFAAIDDEQDAAQAAEEAEIALLSAKNAVEDEVRAAYRAAMTARDTERYLEESAEAAEDAVEQARAAVEAGRAAPSALSVARNAALGARVDLSNQRIDIWLCDKKLEYISSVGPGGL